MCGLKKLLLTHFCKLNNTVLEKKKLQIIIRKRNWVSDEDSMLKHLIKFECISELRGKQFRTQSRNLFIYVIVLLLLSNSQSPISKFNKKPNSKRILNVSLYCIYRSWKILSLKVTWGRNWHRFPICTLSSFIFCLTFSKNNYTLEYNSNR